MIRTRRSRRRLRERTDTCSWRARARARSASTWLRLVKGVRAGGGGGGGEAASAGGGASPAVGEDVVIGLGLGFPPSVSRLLPAPLSWPFSIITP